MVISVIDIFCGAGGFSEGFRQQGYQIAAGIDYWKPAVDTYNYNFNLNCSTRNVLEFEDSVESILALPDTEVIIGSPPCVSFSSSNKSGKADKSMGLRLIKLFLRIVAVKKYKPNSTLKAWIMENVANSAPHLPESYSFRDLNLSDWAGGYGFEADSEAIRIAGKFALINAADYGVPQFRKRAFISEYTDSGLPITPPKTHLEVCDSLAQQRYLTLEKVLGCLPGPHSPESENLVTDPLYPDIQIKQSSLTDQFYDTGLYECEWKISKYLKTNHPYMGRMSFPEKRDRPGRTITATKISMSREGIIFCSERLRKGDGEYRTPTVREAATLMGFPITSQFIGSEGNKWALVGNAVCPPVSRSFAYEIRKHLDNFENAMSLVRTDPGNLELIPNLNTFRIKIFDSPPKKRQNSRFRMHPFKYGNLTVTLSNYDIDQNSGNVGKWLTSIQYGSGKGFPIQTFKDDYYLKLEPLIMGFEGGPRFIDTINNGFSEKIANSEILQRMYDSQNDEHPYVEPSKLINSIRDIVDSIEEHNPIYYQDNGPFLKNSFPKKQIMALYAINKVCAIANGGDK